MNGWSSLLEGPIVYRLGCGLLHFLWQGAVVAGVLSVTLWWLHRRSAGARHRACWIALAAMAACVPVTAWLSQAPSRLPETAGAQQPFVPVADAPPEPVEHGNVALPGMPPPHPLVNAADGEGRTVFQTEQSPLVAPSPAVEPMQSAAPLLGNLRQWMARALPWVVGAWLAGAVGLSLWRLGGWLCLRRLCRHGTAAAPHKVSETFDRLVARLGVSRPVQLLESTLARVPVVVGWLRPVVLLPVAVVGEMSPQELEMVLAHELAHVRRSDFLWNLAQTAVETLLFYHPAVWWVSRRIRAEREACCDDLAAEAMGDRLLYARSLARLEEVRHGGEVPLAPSLEVAADGGSLLPRIRRVLGLPDEACRAWHGWLGGSLAVSLVVAALAAYMALADEATSASEGSAGATAESRTEVEPSAQEAKRDQGEVAKLPGIVTDEQGKPLGGVTITMCGIETFHDGRWRRNWAPHCLLPRPWKSDEAGGFDPSGSSHVRGDGETIRVNLWFEKQGFAPTYLAGAARRPEQVKVVMQRGIRASGTVKRLTDEGLTPLEGATVHVQCSSGDLPHQKRVFGDPYFFIRKMRKGLEGCDLPYQQRVTTDAEGRYTVLLTPPPADKKWVLFCADQPVMLDWREGQPVNGPDFVIGAQPVQTLTGAHYLRPRWALGRIEFGPRLPLRLNAGTATELAVVELYEVSFGQNGGRINALVGGAIRSRPKGKFRVQVALLDKKGNQLQQSSVVVEASGAAEGVPEKDTGELRFQFDYGERVADVAQYCVTLVRAPDDAQATARFLPLSVNVVTNQEGNAEVKTAGPTGEATSSFGVGKPDERAMEAGFGLVIERIVSFNFMEDAAHLDLDTGRHGRNQPGKDLIAAAGESDMRVRSGLDMVAIPVDAKRWDASPDEILAEVAKAEPQRQARLGGPESRRTFFFKTHEGGVGVLHIVPIDDGQGNVKVLYKTLRGTSRQTTWGPAVEGVQLRLRADEKTWEIETLPSFKADIRNQGKQDLVVLPAQHGFEVEVDGRWYFRYAPGHDVPNKEIRPGARCEDIAISLGREWLDKEINKSKRGPERVKRLELAPGRHVVRVAPVLADSDVRAVSNPVEIEIVAPPLLKFGPVWDKTIRDVRSGRDCFIDLDTGRVMGWPPEGLAPFDPERGVTEGLKQFMRANGLDAIGWLPRNMPMFEGLLGLDMKVAEVADTRWFVAASPAGVRGPLSNVRLLGDTIPISEKSEIPPSERTPKAFLFQTREGAVGKLRLDNVGHVALSYQRVWKTEELDQWSDPGPIPLLMRLRPNAPRWAMGQTPELTLDLWNDHHHDSPIMYVGLQEAECELEYDGQRYRWADPVVINGRGRMLKAHRVDMDAVKISLVRSWARTDRPFTGEAEDADRLKLTPGKHTLRVLFQAGYLRDAGKKVQVRSKPVEIEIVPASDTTAEVQPLEAAKGGPGVLLRQLNAGELSDEKIRQITDEVLAIQGDLEQPWDGAWGNWLEKARAMGKVSDAYFTRYAKQSNPTWQMGFNYAHDEHSGRFGLSFRYKYLGGRVASAYTSHSLIVKHRLVRLSLGDLPLDVGGRGGQWSARTQDVGGFFRVPEEIDGLERLRPGKYEAVLVLEAEVYETGRPDKTLHHCRIELKDELELPELLFLELRSRVSWGEAVEGVQVRIKADKPSWALGEVPTFNAEIRNRGRRDLSVAQAQQLCELEVDGRWHHWTGEISVRSSWFPPGREYKGIPVSLVSDWRDKEGGQPVKLGAGKHTVRVAFLCQPRDIGDSSNPNSGTPVRAVSNPVEIEVRPAPSESPPAEAKEGVDGAGAASALAELAHVLETDPRSGKPKAYRAHVGLTWKRRAKRLVAGERIEFYCGVLIENDVPGNYEAVSGTLFITRPDGTQETRELLLYASPGGISPVGDSHQEIDPSTVQVGKYRLVLESMGARSEPLEFEVVELDVMKKLKAELAFGRSGEIAPDTPVPVTLRVENQSDQLVRFPLPGSRRGFVSDDPEIRVTAGSDQSPRQFSLHYPHAKLPGREIEGPPAGTSAPWQEVAQVPMVELQPGGKYELELSLEDALRIWKPWPSQFVVTLSTTLRLFVGEEDGQLAQHCPIRLPVSATGRFEVPARSSNTRRRSPDPRPLNPGP